MTVAISGRPVLSRKTIEARATALALTLEPSALDRSRSPVYAVVKGLIEKYHLPFHFRQKLGIGPNGGKVFGRFDFSPAQILIDESLVEDSARFRWTLCHEIGHYVLHRRINRRALSQRDCLIDCRPELFPHRTRGWSDLHWTEWQANQFAAALLLPEPILRRELIRIQTDLGIPNVGRVFVDDQPQNLQDFSELLSQLANALGASKTMIRYRLIDLHLLNDSRSAHRAPMLQTAVALKAVLLSGLNRQFKSRR